MPIGKDSITKRVAKPTADTAQPKEKNIAPELVATVAAAPTAKKAPAKKTTTTTKKTTAPAKKTTSTAKKPAVKTEKVTPQSEEKKVNSAVLSNISPETVKAVIGHEENKGFEKTQIGEKMPVHLL